ncbi:unnamed protein product [Brassicogethes aeneus]|uniref:Amidase domain-containing protein n=1 Tax=Brassicogethes aeneus TaxID=1431903 RepID=A0A9P0FKR5_BRAAE|nr:unnamed protein product [Brassicogethes aeneus]
MCSLIGAGASLIGIGSDIAGSLRLPSHFCGTWGHKPTPETVSFKGHYPSCKDESAWAEVFTLGPISRYATDLRMLLQIIVKPTVKKKLDLNKPVDISNVRIYYLEQINSPIVDKPNNNVKTAINRVISHFNNICKSSCTKSFCQVSHFLTKILTDTVNSKLQTFLMENTQIYHNFLRQLCLKYMHNFMNMDPLNHYAGRLILLMKM